jgi:hypothetical protein
MSEARQFAVDNVEIGTADAAGEDAQEDLPAFRPGDITVDELKRPAGLRELHRVHVFFRLQSGGGIPLEANRTNRAEEREL